MCPCSGAPLLLLLRDIVTSNTKKSRGGSGREVKQKKPANQRLRNCFFALLFAPSPNDSASIDPRRGPCFLFTASPVRKFGQRDRGRLLTTYLDLSLLLQLASSPGDRPGSIPSSLHPTSSKRKRPKLSATFFAPPALSSSQKAPSIPCRHPLQFLHDQTSTATCFVFLHPLLVTCPYLRLTDWCPFLLTSQPCQLNSPVPYHLRSFTLASRPSIHPPSAHLANPALSH